MSGDATRPFNPTIRALSRSLADARDAQLVEAVALLDALPDRGAADALIAPVRKRLAGLRPNRPLNFCRLLFSPLDPLIVAASRWRPTAPTIPRTVLPPLAETVRRAMGETGAAIEAAIHGHRTQDVAVVAREGSRLWAAAGRILSQAPPPLRWSHTGLPLALYPPLARRIGAVLQELPELDLLASDAANGLTAPDSTRIQAVLLRTATQPTDVMTMALTLLLARVPQATAILGTGAGRMDAAGEAMLRLAGEQAIALLLDQLEAPGVMESQLALIDLMAASMSVRRIIGLLRQAEAAAATQAQRQRVTALRRRLDEIARTRFADGLARDLLMRLRAPDGEVASIEAMEAAARGLRALEWEARALGGTSHYDALLQQAAEQVRLAGPVAGLDRVDQMRLVEILAGADAALAMRAV